MKLGERICVSAAVEIAAGDPSPTRKGGVLDTPSDPERIRGLPARHPIQPRGITAICRIYSTQDQLRWLDLANRVTHPGGWGSDRLRRFAGAGSRADLFHEPL